MATLVPRARSPLPDLLQWFESDWPFGGGHPMRIESYVEDDHYVVRSELPGVDPEKDVHVFVEGNHLEIQAERTQEEHTEGRSEFQYGSFSRSVALPEGCDTDNITADYEAGILTVRMPKRKDTTTREIPIARKGK